MCCIAQFVFGSSKTAFLVGLEALDLSTTGFLCRQGLKLGSYCLSGHIKSGFMSHSCLNTVVDL